MLETEVLTCDGRIDAVIKTQTHIYIIEFKLGTAQEAIEQIQKKQYALKYANENKKIILLGIGFNNDKKNIEEYFIM
ncbi:MAG: PD-(D/E)XK nuclease domain-containing protein [Bacteroidia bacterium]|nr:PD-(D/E)XK nuclease domain-containing protein [Bacteroidia bacterium]